MTIRNEKSKKTREKIIKSALLLFIKQGFAATTTQNIAKRANISEGSIYTHFKNKKQIFEFILSNYHPWVCIPNAVQNSEGNDINEFIKDATKTLQKIWRQNPDQLKIHLIELLEFQGVHLSDLFSSVYQKMEKVLLEKSSQYKFLESYPMHRLHRALSGLFFSVMASQLMDQGFQDDMNGDSFDYFTDLYLQGLIVDLNKNGKNYEKDT
ncbi:TetR/AcrR family transcriptional regulator [Patescibacteria group bacterium]|nr:TetR/AcrR family transcriptional regulator [Patescibacteria group bacterium]